MDRQTGDFARLGRRRAVAVLGVCLLVWIVAASAAAAAATGPAVDVAATGPVVDVAATGPAVDVAATGPVVADANAVADHERPTSTAIATPRLEHEERYWQGQTLYRDAGVGNGETLRIVPRVGPPSLQTVTANDSGVVTIDTGALELRGAYSLERADGTVVANFSVDIQSLQVDVSPTTVAGQGSGTTADVEVTSNRGDAPVTVDVFAEDPAPNEGPVRSASLALDASGEATHVVDFDGVAPGRYDVVVGVTDTGVEEVRTVDVEGPATSGLIGNGPTETRSQAAIESDAADRTTPGDVAPQTVPDDLDPGTTPGDGDPGTTPDDGDAGEAATATDESTPQRGFFVNGEDDPGAFLGNLLNLTVLGFVVSTVSLLYQLKEGR